MTFDLYSLGIGINRDFKLSKSLSFYSAFGIDRYSGKLKLSWRHSRNTRRPLPEGIGQLVDAEFKKSAWSWNAEAGLTRSITTRLSIQAGIHYRKIKFSRLQFTGSYEYGFLTMKRNLYISSLT